MISVVHNIRRLAREVRTLKGVTVPSWDGGCRKRHRLMAAEEFLPLPTQEAGYASAAIQQRERKKLHFQSKHSLTVVKKNKRKTDDVGVSRNEKNVVVSIDI